MIMKRSTQKKKSPNKMDDSNASIQDNSSDINDTQSHIEDLDVDNDASDESETIQAVVEEEDTPQKQPHTTFTKHF